MRRLSGLTLVVVVAILVSAAWAVAAGTATATYVYVVPGSTVPGLSTDVVLDAAASATITASGAICPYGGSFCPGPNGDTGWNTTGILYGGFPLPGAPAWGLLARVGSGPWVQVGSGPTTVAGTGVLEFAVNDDFLALFAKLPVDVRARARKNYRLWQQVPAHPSLHFKKIH